MKKILNAAVSAAALGFMLAAFVSCSNGSDSSSTPAPAGTISPLSDSATVNEVPQVTTSVTSASYSSNTATLSASNGTYVLTGTAVQPNIAISASQGQSIGGTWKFTETNATSPKYIGSYTGDISSIGASNTILTLKVEKILNNGLLTAVVEKKDISMTVPTSGTFDATIPAVKVSSVTSYMQANVNPWFSSEDNYNLTSNIEKIDLSDGKVTYSALAARKSTSRGNVDDNSYKIDSGTYTAPVDGKITITIANKPLTLTITEDGNLFSPASGSTSNLTFNLINASVKIYGYAATKLDGANSYSEQKFVNLYGDSAKTAQFMDIKQVTSQKTVRDTKTGTYEISGNTVTLTGSGYSKTATISDDGKTLTLDGIAYRKL